MIAFANLVNTGGQTFRQAKRRKGLVGLRENPLPLSPPETNAPPNWGCFRFCLRDWVRTHPGSTNLQEQI